MSGPLVVGVDGSPHAAVALEWAAGLARDLGTEVVAVYALGLLAHLPGGEEPAQDHRREIEERLSGPWTETLKSSGVRYRTEVVDGNPVIALLTAADRHGARMVVVGRRGTGGFPGLQLGSTSHQLAQHAEVPLAIIP
jgi:nucleotide-binding universal stress UspA family protein